MRAAERDSRGDPPRNSTAPVLSIVIPARNEEVAIAAALAALPAPDSPREVIVVDSGSTDGTAARAAAAARVVTTDHRGRGHALDVGAGHATGEVLLFLHVDTRLPDGAEQAILEALRSPGVVGGWFRRRLDDPRWRYRVVDLGANLFSAVCRIATGDQAIFCRRSTFLEVGGCARYPLFEDMSLCRLLRRKGELRPLKEHVLVSSRRFARRGIVSTVWTNLSLTARYFMGADPAVLYDSYYVDRSGR